MADLFVILIYALLFIIVCLVGLLSVIYVILSPFKQYFIAKLKGKDCMFIIQRDGKISMMAATFWDNVYGQQPSPPWSYLRKDATLYRLGGVKCVPIIDNWNITKDCALRDKVEKLKEHGIENYEQMRKRVDVEQLIEAQSHISGKPIGENDIILINQPFMRNAFDIIDFNALMGYIDSVYLKEIESYIDKEISEFLNTFVLNKNKSTNWTLIILIIAIVGGVIMMGIIGAKLLGLW